MLALSSGTRQSRSQARRSRLADTACCTVLCLDALFGSPGLLTDRAPSNSGNCIFYLPKQLLLEWSGCCMGCAAHRNPCGQKCWRRKPSLFSCTSHGRTCRTSSPSPIRWNTETRTIGTRIPNSPTFMNIQKHFSCVCNRYGHVTTANCETHCRACRTDRVVLLTAPL